MLNDNMVADLKLREWVSDPVVIGFDFLGSLLLLLHRDCCFLPFWCKRTVVSRETIAHWTIKNDLGRGFLFSSSRGVTKEKKRFTKLVLV